MMSIASLLAAAQPMLATVISGQSLHLSLAEAPVPMRSIEVASSSLTERLTASHEEPLAEELGALIRDKISIHDAALDAEQNIYRVDGGRERVYEFLRLRFRSYSNLAESAHLVEGKWPSPEVGRAPNGQDLVEIAVGAEAAQLMELQTGDQFAVLAQGEPLNSERSHFIARIVGVLAPVDPDAETWWGDRELLPFSLQRENVTQDLQRINLSAFVPVDVMEAQIPEHRHYWYILVDTLSINVSNAASFRDRFIRLSSRLETMTASIDSGLPELIATFTDQQSRAQVSLLLLSTHALLAVAYVLWLLSSTWPDRFRYGVATMVARGFSSVQITLGFAAEATLLALGMAVPLGVAGSFGSSFTGGRRGAPSYAHGHLLALVAGCRRACLAGICCPLVSRDEAQTTCVSTWVAPNRAASQKKARSRTFSIAPRGCGHLAVSRPRVRAGASD
jgi:hypothetical protein